MPEARLFGPHLFTQKSANAMRRVQSKLLARKTEHNNTACVIPCYIEENIAVLQFETGLQTS